MKLFAFYDSNGYVLYEQSAFVALGDNVMEIEESIGIAPSDWHRFNIFTKQWVDTITLDDRKGIKWSEMKAAREAAFNAPLVTPFGVFDCTPSARQSITDAVMRLQTLESLGTPTDIEFTLADNTEVSLTTAEMVQVGLLLGAKTQEAYARGRQVRQLVTDAVTIAEVEAITF